MANQNLDTQTPIVASARTGLAGKDDAIIKRVPANYAGKTVGEVLDYIVETDLTQKEVPLAESVRRELHASGSVVAINGKTAGLEDTIGQYLVEREHKLPDGTARKYLELEIEVSAVQQGGFYR